MTDLTLDPRALDLLAEGPTRAPSDAYLTIVARVATTPQERPWLRLRGRPVRIGPAQIAMAAALIVAVAGVGGVVLRDPIADVLAPPPSADSLLAPFPGTRSIIEANGGPADAASRTSLGALPDDEAVVLAASCTGDGQVTLEVIDPNVSAAPGEMVEPVRRLDVPCDGAATTLPFQTFGERGGDGALRLELAADAGTTWRVEVGQMRSLPAAPSFEGAQPRDGEVVMLEDTEAHLVAGRASSGLGVDPRMTTALVVDAACLGDPIAIYVDNYTGPAGGVEVGRMACGPGVTTGRFEVAPGAAGDVHARSDGFTWVRLATLTAPGTSTRPTAPALPDGFADVQFAEGDGENVAFGSLGSNQQAIVRVDGSSVGQPGGGVVAIARPGDGDASVLELWSIGDAAPLRTLATVAGASIFGSWVDPTHQQVFYGTVDALGSGSWHRVGFEGGESTKLDGTPVGIREATQALAPDDSTFVTQWCPLVGGCKRTVVDAATLAATTVDRDDDGFCNLVGTAAGVVVGTIGDCDSAAPPRYVAVDLTTGAQTDLFEGLADTSLVQGPDGPRLVALHIDDYGVAEPPPGAEQRLEVMSLDGTARREVALTGRDPGAYLNLSRLRLPAGDWVLLAGPIGDNPGGGSPSALPLLLNVETGEQIELVNLPGE